MILVHVKRGIFCFLLRNLTSGFDVLKMSKLLTLDLFLGHPPPPLVGVTPFWGTLSGCTPLVGVRVSTGHVPDIFSTSDPDIKIR